jgi:hypothetical protein
MTESANLDLKPKSPDEPPGEALYRTALGLVNVGTRQYYEAVPTLDQASREGSGKASFLLGNIYRYDLDRRIPHDYTLARQYYERSIEQGYPEAYCHLAEMKLYKLGFKLRVSSNAITILQYLLEGCRCAQDSSNKASCQTIFNKILKTEPDNFFMYNESSEVFDLLCRNFSELKALSQDNSAREGGNEALKLELMYQLNGPGFISKPRRSSILWPINLTDRKTIMLWCYSAVTSHELIHVIDMIKLIGIGLVSVDHNRSL